MIFGNFTSLSTWDLGARRQVGAIPTHGGFPQFSTDGNWLFVASYESREIYARTVQKKVSDTETTYTIGPARTLPFLDQTATDGVDSPSRQFGTIGHQGRNGQLVYYDKSSLSAHTLTTMKRNQNNVDVSGDGRLMAVGNWHESNVYIWDVATGKHIKTIGAPGNGADVRFSPDGRVLAISESGRCAFYDAESWKLLHETSAVHHGSLPRPVVFSPHGSIAAFTTNTRRSIQLISTATYRELATFELPDNLRVTSMAFSPDGSLLIVGPGDGSHVHFWDLRKIRTRLGHLDWNSPATAKPTLDVSIPIRVELESDQETSGGNPPALILEPPGGSFRNPVSVTIRSNEENATPHFTLDGSRPSRASRSCAGPLTIESSLTLRAELVNRSGLGVGSADARFFIDPHAIPTEDSHWRVWDVTGEHVNNPGSRWLVRQDEVHQLSNIWDGTLSVARRSDGSLRRDGTLRIFDGAEDFTNGDFTNGDFSFEVCSGDNDAVGAAFRLADPEHFYLFAMNKEQSYRILARRSGVAFDVLDATTNGYELQRWYHVRINLNGPKLTVYIDGEKELEATDETFIQGTVALYCWGSPLARFRHLTLTPAKSTQAHSQKN